MKDYTNQFKDDIGVAVEFLDVAASRLSDWEETESMANRISEISAKLDGILFGMEIEKSGKMRVEDEANAVHED